MTRLRAQEGVPFAQDLTVLIEGVTALTAGYTSVMRIASDGLLVLELTEGAGLTTTAGVGEVVIGIELTAAQTALLEKRSYEVAVDLLLSGAVVQRPLRGELVVEPDVVAG